MVESFFLFFLNPSLVSSNPLSVVPLSFQLFNRTVLCIVVRHLEEGEEEGHLFVEKWHSAHVQKRMESGWCIIRWIHLDVFQCRSHGVVVIVAILHHVNEARMNKSLSQKKTRDFLPFSYSERTMIAKKKKRGA